MHWLFDWLIRETRSLKLPVRSCCHLPCRLLHGHSCFQVVSVFLGFAPSTVITTYFVLYARVVVVVDCGASWFLKLLESVSSEWHIILMNDLKFSMLWFHIVAASRVSYGFSCLWLECMSTASAIARSSWSVFNDPSTAQGQPGVGNKHLDCLSFLFYFLPFTESFNFVLLVRTPQFLRYALLWACTSTQRS